MSRWWSARGGRKISDNSHRMDRCLHLRRKHRYAESSESTSDFGINWERSSSAGAHSKVWVSFQCHQHLPGELSLLMLPFRLSWFGREIRRSLYFLQLLLNSGRILIAALLPRFRYFQLKWTLFMFMRRPRSVPHLPLSHSLHWAHERHLQRSRLTVRRCSDLSSTRQLPSAALLHMSSWFSAQSMPITGAAWSPRYRAPFSRRLQYPRLTSLFKEVPSASSLSAACAGPRRPVWYGIRGKRCCLWWKRTGRNSQTGDQFEQGRFVFALFLRIRDARSWRSDRCNDHRPSPRPFGMEPEYTRALGCSSSEPRHAAAECRFEDVHKEREIFLSNGIDSSAWVVQCTSGLSYWTSRQGSTSISCPRQSCGTDCCTCEIFRDRNTENLRKAWFELAVCKENGRMDSCAWEVGNAVEKCTNFSSCVSWSNLIPVT